MYYLLKCILEKSPCFPGELTEDTQRPTHSRCYNAQVFGREMGETEKREVELETGGR